MYKTQIDAYNRRLSDTANMFKESNELIYVLTNYDDTDLSEFKRNMRHYGAIKVSNVDGGVDTIEIKVPVENTEKYLKMLYENIMLFGQAVDFSSDKFGSAPSGVALEFLYTNLNLKVNHKEIDISFNYNKVANTELQVQMAQSSMGVVSHETVIENHPFVEDLEAELERIQNERYELNKQLPSITGESDEQQEQHRDNNTE